MTIRDAIRLRDWFRRLGKHGRALKDMVPFAAYPLAWRAMQPDLCLRVWRPTKTPYGKNAELMSYRILGIIFTTCRSAAVDARLRLESKHRHSRKREDGFTLVEMLVVITIIGLIVSLVGPRVLNYLSDSKVKATRIQIEGFAAALDLYYLDNGSYPTSSPGLAALVQKPEDSSHWTGPYLKGTTVPNDPWGKPYSYIFPGQHGNPYDIVSFGSDGREGGADNAADITNWQK